MGAAQAREIVKQAANLGLDQEIVLRWHLQHNHYPPVPLEFMKPAKEAIAAVEVGEWSRPIILPNGLIRSADEVVEVLHLDEFVRVVGEEWFEPYDHPEDWRI